MNCPKTPGCDAGAKLPHPPSPPQQDLEGHARTRHLVSKHRELRTAHRAKHPSPRRASPTDVLVASLLQEAKAPPPPPFVRDGRSKPLESPRRNLVPRMRLQLPKR
jgi:hypothetical protein